MRTAQKTATYAVMHLTVAVAVTYALTRNWHVALAVGLIEPVIQTFAFSIHERVWARADSRAQALVSMAPPASSASALA